MKIRIEHDTMGEVSVPADKYWGAQTQRSFQNFKIGEHRMPLEVIHALAILKKAAALANEQLDVLDHQRASAIVRAADEIAAGKLDEHFPLVVYQTGSGTQSNMNVNEVISNRANELLGENLVHPNDHVNKSQSSNDTFPTAMHIAAVVTIENHLLPALHALEESFETLEAENETVIKVGRTHLQDAVPLTLGQEISAWKTMLIEAENMLQLSVTPLKKLALGGTAVGTGLNAPNGFDVLSAKFISEITGKNFLTAPNKFHALTSKDALVFCHGAIKALAANLMKIANDIRWLASGPRCGIGELTIPENEPGSSIMPGKVNPTQCEAVTMVCLQVMGNDATIAMAASQGNFQLNVFMPVIIYNFLESSRLLSDAMISFNQNCVIGIKANQEKIKENMDKSLMLVTALNPIIGYENAAKIAKKAYNENLSLKEAASLLGFISNEDFDRIVSPSKMIR